MRPLYVFAVGLLGGIIITVMVQTLDPSRGSDGPPERGHVRVSFDEEHLAAITLAAWANRVEGLITVDVERRGTLQYGFVPLGGLVPVNVRLNPNIVAGKLEIVVDGEATPEANELANVLQATLAQRLKEVSGVEAPRLTAISTTGGRLGFELMVDE